MFFYVNILKLISNVPYHSICHYFNFQLFWIFIKPSVENEITVNNSNEFQVKLPRKSF